MHEPLGAKCNYPSDITYCLFQFSVNLYLKLDFAIAFLAKREKTMGLLLSRELMGSESHPLTGKLGPVKTSVCPFVRSSVRAHLAQNYSKTNQPNFPKFGTKINYRVGIFTLSLLLREKSRKTVYGRKTEQNRIFQYGLKAILIWNA